MQAGYQATTANDSNFIGRNAGYQASSATAGNFIGNQAGYQATSASEAVFIGTSTGTAAINANYSIFIGNQAGNSAAAAERSNFIGINAGYQATSASYSNFIGNGTGFNAVSASYSTLIGSNVGYASSGTGIGSNNVIIGTNITLENNRKDSINLGGIIFATGSYSNLGTNPFSSSMTEAKVGINKSLPEYTLDVSGSIGIATVLHIAESDPLPAGNIGDLAVSASHLWFYNGAWSQLD
jgi:hypothetical protein